MEQIIDNFHFLRPQWLWAFVPVAVLTALFWNSRVRGVGSAWGRYIDSHLLTHLSVTGERQRQHRVIPFVAVLASGLIVLGLAGPTWQKSDLPSFTGGEPVVAVLSLAQSMNADDLTPSRLKRSVHKLRDILARTEGDERGLVIYSDVPFVAAPLTNDQRVIEQMLPELSTSLMPVLGNRLDLAIDEARQVLERAEAHRGQIIVIADNAGSDPDASLTAAEAVRGAGYELSVLAVGTEQGATLQTADGRAISTRDGQTFMTKLARDELIDLSSAGGGRFSMITPGDSDLIALLPATDQSMHAAGKAQDFTADSWVDMGYWLLIIPALLAPFLFRRGMIMGLVFVATGLMAQPNPAAAGVWNDLWATRDQQGREAFENGDFSSAAKTFETPDWQAGAAYRSGDFETAIAAYSRVDHPDTDYNLGNALAWSGDLEGALAAYDRALEANLSDGDARFNRDLIAELLEQQKQEEQQQNEDQQQDQSEDRQGAQDQQQQQQQQGSDDQQQQQGQNGQQKEQPSEQGSQEQQQAEDQSGSSGSEQESDAAGADQAEGSQDQAQNSEGNEQTEQSSSNGAERKNGEEPGQPESDADSAEAQVPESDNRQEAAQNGRYDREHDHPGQSSEQMTDQQQDRMQQAAGDSSQQTSEENEAGENPLSELLSRALAGNGEEEQVEAAPSAGASPVNQAVEQQLRRVPDDPSGLLRARIHQHYARMNATQ